MARDTFGLTPEQYTYIIETVIRPLESEGAQVWCFGSRARGTQQPFSDLDLMVVAPQMPAREANERLFLLLGRLQETLIDSCFPFKVDLILEQNFAESYRPSYDRDKKRFTASL